VDESLKREMLALLPRLRRFALALTGAASDADDLVQATCERAIRHLDKWQPGTRLDSWMYRIAQNLHRNAIRDGQTRARHLEVIANDADGARDGEAAMHSHLTLAAVHRRIAGLPPEQREVLALVAVEGCSYREAADILELPIGTVTSRLARARQTLKDFVEGLER
jgi:RNA polymerase sigma-70 factor (ECF subfamily)